MRCLLLPPSFAILPISLQPLTVQSICFPLIPHGFAKFEIIKKIYEDTKLHGKHS